MDKQFELSAYGVEEMNEKEMIVVDGGIIPGVVWAIIGAVSGAISAYYAVRAYYDGQRLYRDRRYIPIEDSTIIDVGTADSLVVDGATIYGLKDVTIIRP